MRIRTVLLAASALFAVLAAAVPMTASAKSSPMAAPPEVAAPPEPLVISEVVPAESIPLTPGAAVYECPRGFQIDAGSSGAGGDDLIASTTRTALLVSRTGPSAEGAMVEIQLVCTRGQSDTARIDQAR